MGAWGSGLYANDTTNDIRESYIGHLEDGLGSKEAYDKILDDFKELIGDPDEESLLWYALAETQWKTGRLTPEVKEKALEWIEKGGGLSLWEESKTGGAGWKKTLDKLKVKLESPMPPEKKIHKPEVPNKNPWNLNDIYAYQFHTEASKKSGFYGKYMLLQKIGEENKYFPETVMRIHVLDHVFDNLPTLDDMEGLRILPLDLPYRVRMNDKKYCGVYAGIHMNNCIDMYLKRAYPAKYLTYIGNRPGPANKQFTHPSNQLAWESIEEGLFQYQLLWRGIEYETVEEGVYWYENKLTE